MAAVSVEPRDIIFTFKDSCNCCSTLKCCKKEEVVDRAVYVNSKGDLEPYKRRKSLTDEQLSFSRSKRHLHETLADKIIRFNIEADTFQMKTRNIIRSIECLGRVNKAHIDAINEIMLKSLSARR